jgi:hypothetical protein
MNAHNATKFSLLYGSPPTTLGEYARTAYEADECDCAKCESIRAEDGPSDDNWLDPENNGGFTYTIEAIKETT